MVDDHELWGPIRGRDASAEAFYRDNAARLCAFLRQLVGSPQAAEGLMQETFTHMWKSPNGFRPRSRVAASRFSWSRNSSPKKAAAAGARRALAAARDRSTARARGDWR